MNIFITSEFDKGTSRFWGADSNYISTKKYEMGIKRLVTTIQPDTIIIDHENAAEAAKLISKDTIKEAPNTIVIGGNVNHSIEDTICQNLKLIKTLGRDYETLDNRIRAIEKAYSKKTIAKKIIAMMKGGKPMNMDTLTIDGKEKGDKGQRQFFEDL